ncbi:putative F-box domain-containing protein [Medicago truncatula]|uniref:F-box protein interaction domain protein n=1 Tax=Medicago truncatula TaxID=3880 RepID=G7L4H4_MEDTR|nr:F-box protein interaction domain protein [Medicago truncatula]RHN46104.1 putative F-box domain-containing protein [Medicago truncatula]
MNLLPPSQLQVFLPGELIVEVLSFLPVKSLMRLKCVSKSWKYLISEPSFAKLHLNRTTQDAVRTIVSYHMHSRDVSFTVFRLLENPPIIINLPKNPYHQLNDKDCHYIVGSCNGLLCLFGGTGYREDNGGYRENWLRFWNPATRIISEKFHGDDGLGFPCNYTFGYDNSTETYKVVYFTRKTTNVRVFSLGVNVWRNIQDSPMIHHHWQMKVVHVKDSVNWLAIHNYISDDYNCEGITIGQFVIISLDLGTEAYTKLFPPHGFSEVPFVIPKLSVLNDYLCFFHDFKQTHFVIWQMKEFGFQESWTQLFKISYQNIQSDYNVNDLCRCLLPLYLLEKNDTLLLTRNYIFSREPILYNLRDNRAKRINIPWWHNCQNYVESLISYC